MMLSLVTAVLVFGAVTTAPPPGDCPTATDEYRPHEFDCEKFYRCDVTGWVEFTCAPGTLFDSTSLLCIWPDQANCYTTSSDVPCDASPCQNGGTCSDAGSGYVCQCTASYTGTNCETDVQDNSNAPTGTCQTGSVYEADPADCGQFYACVNNVWALYDCPQESPAFNTITAVCDFIYNVDCGSRPTVCTNNSRLQGNDSECREFYVCSNSSDWVKYNCPFPLRFNNAAKDCTTDAVCPTSTETTTVPPTTTTTVGSSLCTNNPCLNGGTCVQDTLFTFRCLCPPYSAGTICDIECQYPCPAGVTIIYPDLTNSSQAVMCALSTLQILPCPTGEQWSISTNRCQPQV